MPIRPKDHSVRTEGITSGTRIAMGTWDDGLLDNDTALDGLGDLKHTIVADIVAFGAMKPTATSTAKLGAAVGILLQLSAYDFGLETETGPKIATAVKAHGGQIAKLPSAARKVLEAVGGGQGATLAGRPAKMSARQIAILRKDASRAPFGKREPSLFASKAAPAYVQQVARRCIAMVDDDFRDKGNWSDLCREGMGIGCLGVLLVLEPCSVPSAKLERWRRAAKKGITTLREDADDELDFHEGYYANLDAALALLQRRFAKK
jgi:hypothetical protein